MILTPPSRYDYIPYPHSYNTLPSIQPTGYPASNTRYELGAPDSLCHAQQYPPDSYSAASHPSVYGISDSRPPPFHLGLVQQSSANTYHTATAPILPPIRIPERSFEIRQQTLESKTHSKVPPPPQEEKTGGVAAHLDYKMEDMIDFVSEMAQTIVMSANSAVRPDLRKYVHHILTSTRLPSSTILLALHYLTVRMTLLSERSDYSSGGGDIHKMLTTALILGSKFLDDNTFQNRSWSDVSNISVGKLNTLELEWLIDIRWAMHFDPSDPRGFALWQRCWRSFQSKKVDTLADSMKRTSLDNVLPLQYALQYPPSTNAPYQARFRDGHVPAPYTANPASLWPPHYEKWRHSRHPTEYSPPSAPETGPSTPSHAFPSHYGYGQMLPPIYPSLKVPPPALHILPSNAPPSGFSTPYSSQHYYPTHGQQCGCTLCLPQSERYSMASSYGQAVA